MTTHTIAGEKFTVGPANSNPRRYHFVAEDAPYWARNDERSYATEGEAFAAALRFLGITEDTTPKCPCGKPATMAASTGSTCEDCYDTYADMPMPRQSTPVAAVPATCTTRQAAEKLGCSVRTIQRRAQRGQIAAVKVDGRWTITL